MRREGTEREMEAGDMREEFYRKERGMWGKGKGSRGKGGLRGGMRAHSSSAANT